VGGGEPGINKNEQKGFFMKGLPRKREKQENTSRDLAKYGAHWLQGVTIEGVKQGGTPKSRSRSEKRGAIV